MRHLSCFAVLALLTVAGAQSPTFASLVPTGGQRGTEVKVKVTGSRLTGIQEPFLSRDGLEVVRAEHEGKDTFITLRIAADCPLGHHPIRLRTRRGVTNMRLFSVGTRPEIVEPTPNDSREQAKLIAMDTTVNGELGAEDVDWFAVDAPANGRVRIEVESNRLGINSDPKLTVYDSEGAQVAVSDDTPHGRLDPIIALDTDKATRYFIELINGAPGYANGGRYRLHVGGFPRPVAHLPAGGRPGELTEVTFYGDGDPWTEKVKFPRDARTHDHFPRTEDGTAPTPLHLAVRDIDNVIEPQAGPRKPIEFAAPAALNGILGAPGEIDRYRFKATKGQRLEIAVLARQLRSPVDAVLSVRQSKGSYRASNDDRAGSQPDSRVNFRAPADGEYQIAVQDRLGRGGRQFFYRVEVAPADNRTTTRVSLEPQPEYVPVPAGGRMMTVLSVQNGPQGSAPTFFDLPPGVSAHAGSIVPGSSLVPVVFEAAAKAALAGSRASLGLQSPGDNSVIRAPLEHYCPLQTIRNNQVYQGRYMHALPIAVTAVSPYSVEVVPPKIPLVQGSPLSLLVRVKRSDSFKGDVRVKMPWVPPGISASEVTIPRGKTEAKISLSARTNAAARTYKTAIYGFPTVEGGILRCSSQLFELTVASPWMTGKLGKARTEQGVATELSAELGVKKQFAGEVEAQLLNLPSGVKSAAIKIAADTTKVTFPLTVSKKAAPGKHTGSILRLLVPSPEGQLVHYFRGGELRIDKPIAARPAPAKQ